MNNTAAVTVRTVAHLSGTRTVVYAYDKHDARRAIHCSTLDRALEWVEASLARGTTVRALVETAEVAR